MVMDPSGMTPYATAAARAAASVGAGGSPGLARALGATSDEAVNRASVCSDVTRKQQGAHGARQLGHARRQRRCQCKEVGVEGASAPSGTLVMISF